MKLKLLDSKFSEIKIINSLEIENGNKTLVIMSQGGKERGYKDILESLTNTKLNKTQDIFVNSYPSLKNLEELISNNSSNMFTNVIAVGGGSVIDTAKILTSFIGVNNPMSLKNTIGSTDILSSNIKKPHLIVIPTTAGTGAEATQFATIWDRENNKKYSLDHPNLLPDSVYFVPELLFTSSYKTLLFTALDTLSHSLESIWNINATKDSLEFSSKSIQNSFIYKNLDLNAKEFSTFKSLFKASYYSGKAINITRTSVAHSISYPLTLKYGVPHGLACSFTLDAIYKICEINIDNSEKLNTMIRNSLKNLKKLSLNKELNNYLSLNQSLELIDKMITKDRVRTFSGNIDKETIKEILRASF